MGVRLFQREEQIAQALQEQKDAVLAGHLAGTPPEAGKIGASAAMASNTVASRHNCRAGGGRR